MPRTLVSNPGDGLRACTAGVLRDARSVVPVNDLAARCARAAHDVNRTYCQQLGDNSQLPWCEAPDWQQRSAIAGAKAILENPNRTPQESHEGWLAQKQAEGWTWGPVKDAELKQHPCMLPYDELPPAQRAKDAIFIAVVLGIAQNETDHA